MKKRNKSVPEGMRDLLFEECLARGDVETRLAKAFELRGYKEVMTSGLEFMEVCDPEVSGIAPESMYKLTDRHGRLVVMRPDSTLPIARLAATRLLGHALPLRLYYVQPVWRSNPGLAGLQDENMQAGVELMGAAGIRADLEVLTTAVEALSTCVPDFRLELGHAGFFRALAVQLPIDEDVREDIRSSIESKNYAALDAILDGLPPSQAVDAMRRLPRLFGGEEVFAEAESVCPQETTAGPLAYLHKVYHAIQDLGLGTRVIVDLGLVQRNDYYSGIVFTAYTEGYGDSVLMGGRYDNLLSHFGRPMPATGFAINVDALTRIALRKGYALLSPELLVYSEKGYAVKALQYARQCAQAGVLCETSAAETLEDAKAEAQSRGIRRLVVVGKTQQEVLL